MTIPDGGNRPSAVASFDRFDRLTAGRLPFDGPWVCDRAIAGQAMRVGFEHRAENAPGLSRHSFSDGGRSCATLDFCIVPAELASGGIPFVFFVCCQACRFARNVGSSDPKFPFL